jgi:hypothetical protein
MMLTTRDQAKSQQAVMAEVLADFAKNSPKTRAIRNNDFDPPGFTPPPDNWLNDLRSTSTRAQREMLAINVKTRIEDDWNSDLYDRFQVLLVSQDTKSKEVTWKCGTVSEEP